MKYLPKVGEDGLYNKKKMSEKTYIRIIGKVVLAGALFFVFAGARNISFEAIDNFDGEITIYKPSSCGCCGFYSNYIKKMVSSNVKVVDFPDMDHIKKQYGVPEALESCHTTIVGSYFVEGHTPLEAVNKLLEEKPDIAGIAIEGMPSGAPGMSGDKQGDFVIYAVNKDGTYQEFMRL